MKLIQSGAVQLDADVCNTVIPPVNGCHAGLGAHVDIPGDWQAQILSGQQVPGCSYYRVQGGMALLVDDFLDGQLQFAAVVNALPAPLKAQAALLKVKLAAATVVAAVAVGERAEETP
jgi:hypothetical protein